MIHHSIPLAGVIGSPIAHSKSPRLQNYWLKTYGISGFYVPMEVASANLRDVLNTLPKMGFVGTNVTLPHKEAVLELADEVSDRAAAIGAANTLTFQPDGRIHADNTDGFGFIENLRQGAPRWQAQTAPALLLGAGGAARAVLAALLEDGADRIFLTNRTRERAEKLAEEFGNRVQVMNWDEIADILGQIGLLVNSTVLGMTGKPELSLPLDALTPETVVTDLVYAPLETQLLRAAKERGCVTVDGLGMLLYQAVPGFERWFGARPVVDAETRAVVLG